MSVPILLRLYEILMFELHPQLAADTVFIQKMELSQVLLSKDCRFPWLILVPEIDGASDLHALEPQHYRTVCEEIQVIASKMQSALNPDKMNIASLGNMVPQLHIHIVARWKEDAAWPAPIWGNGEAIHHTEDELQRKIKHFQDILN